MTRRARSWVEREDAACCACSLIDGEMTGRPAPRQPGGRFIPVPGVGRVTPCVRICILQLASKDGGKLGGASLCVSFPCTHFGRVGILRSKRPPWRCGNYLSRTRSRTYIHPYQHNENARGTRTALVAREVLATSNKKSPEIKPPGQEQRPRHQGTYITPIARVQRKPPPACCLRGYIPISDRPLMRTGTLHKRAGVEGGGGAYRAR